MEKSCPGKRLTLPAESTLASIYMRNEVHPFAGVKICPPGTTFLYINGALLICRPQSLEKNRRVVSGFWPFKQKENVGWK